MRHRKTLLTMIMMLALVATACAGESLEGDDAAADEDAVAADASEGDDTASAEGEDACVAGDESLDGAELTVASKDFDEQLILGNISAILLEDAGVTVDDQINLGGTEVARSALVSGEIDHYWEYTGTAWISFYEESDPIPDRIEQYEAVAERDAAENGLCWIEPAPFNNTYGIAFRSEAADELGNPTSIADISTLIDEDAAAATLCVESEFFVRNDGLPGMEETYGYEFPEENVSQMDTGVVYEATDAGDPCNFGEVFTTDGRIAASDLTVLEDSEGFFPLYNVSPVFTAEQYNTYGTALEELYAPVAEALTQEVMTQLNARVSAENERPEAVAQAFLEENGLLSE